MFSKGANSNKRRLYLAIYCLPTSEVPPGGDPYHYAILWMRKNPAATDQDTVCYHVVDVPAKGGTGWVFQSDVQLQARTAPLAALVLLAKVDATVTHQILEEYLQTVSIKSIPGEPTIDAAWCVSALRVLVQKEVLVFMGNYQGSLMEILRHGREFVARKPLNTKAPVPTCSPHGIEISSEVKYSV